jgi:uncharacterized membrane protein
MEENNLSNQSPQQGQNANQQYNQIPLPNSAAVLVLGILSIVLCMCAGIVGLICGIIALVLANKANAIYQTNPNSFTLASFKNMKAGKICAIIGTILSALYFIYYIIIIAVVGTAMTQMPWDKLMH